MVHPIAGAVGGRDASPHGLHELLDQGQPDAGAAGSAGEGIFHPVEIVEELFRAWRGMPGPVSATVTAT